MQAISQIDRDLQDLSAKIQQNTGSLGSAYDRWQSIGDQFVIYQALYTAITSLRDGERFGVEKRLKLIIKFCFEKCNSVEKRIHHRRQRLLEMGWNGLKVCGVCFNVKELKEMADSRFEFLTERITQFRLFPYLAHELSRPEFRKVVLQKFVPEDVPLFNSFCQSLIAQPPALISLKNEQVKFDCE